MILRFAPQIAFRDAMQFLVHQRNQMIQSLPVAIIHASEKQRDRLRNRFSNRRQTWFAASFGGMIEMIGQHLYKSSDTGVNLVSPISGFLPSYGRLPRRKWFQ